MHLRPRLILLVALAALAGAAPDGLAAPPEPGVVGETGRRWLIPGGPILRAGPGTELRLLGKPQEIQIQPGRRRPVYTVIVKSGSVDVEVPPGSQSAVALAAPQRLTVLVRSGRMGLRAGRDLVALANVDGDSLVGHDSRHFRALRRGKIRRFERGGVDESALLEPPSELAGQRVFISTGARVPLESLYWKGRDGARGYRVELLQERAREPLLRVDTRDPVLPRALLELEPGKYRVAVRAIDSLGFESAGALESSLHVIAAELPRGAYFDAAGDIRLAPGGLVQLAHSAGLEISYSRFRHEAVLGALGLAGVEPLTVFVRSGSDEPLPLRIAPRTVRAHIAITPRRATWPADALVIRLELEDPSGQPVPDWLQIEPRVLLGVDEVPLHFERVGRAWRAVMPPQGGRGPWVVRVEAHDQFGVPLGYDFLEIAASSG